MDPITLIFAAQLGILLSCMLYVLDLKPSRQSLNRLLPVNCILRHLRRASQPIENGSYLPNKEDPPGAEKASSDSKSWFVDSETCHSNLASNSKPDLSDEKPLDGSTNLSSQFEKRAILRLLRIALALFATGCFAFIGKLAILLRLRERYDCSEDGWGRLFERFNSFSNFKAEGLGSRADLDEMPANFCAGLQVKDESGPDWSNLRYKNDRLPLRVQQALRLKLATINMAIFRKKHTRPLRVVFEVPEPAE